MKKKSELEVFLFIRIDPLPSFTEVTKDFLISIVQNIFCNSYGGIAGIYTPFENHIILSLFSLLNNIRHTHFHKIIEYLKTKLIKE